MSKKKKSLQSKKKVETRWRPDLSLYLTLCLLTLISLFGIYKEFYMAPQTTPVAENSEYIRITTPNIFFYTKVFLNRDRTFITFPYYFESQPQTVWLNLQTQPGNPGIKRLIMHPLLQNLDWQRLENKELTLYQRDKKFLSLEQFLTSPPPATSILIDKPVTTLTGDTFKTAINLTETMTAIPAAVNYILTTFKPSKVTDNRYLYENSIDAQTAQPNDKNELVWMLEVPQNSSASAFYLGQIHVDYRQQP